MGDKLDLAFCMDCTGSMGSYIQSACDNIEKIVREIIAAEKADVRFSLIRYRDFCDKGSSYLVQAEEFTSSLKKMKEYLEKTNAGGGGDAPEAVATGLFAALQLPFREDAIKIVIWIADAPPHGLGDAGYGADDYPEGDPEPTPDILETVGSLKEKGVIVYSVGVEPSVGSYPLLRGFMRGVADRTGGRYVPLGNAPLLAQVIIGGAREEINLERISSQVQEEVEQVERELGSEVSEDEIFRIAAERLASRGVKTGQMQVEDVVGADELSEKVAKVFSASSTLRAAKETEEIKSAVPANNAWSSMALGCPMPAAAPMCFAAPPPPPPMPRAFPESESFPFAPPPPPGAPLGMPTSSAAPYFSRPSAMMSMAAPPMVMGGSAATAPSAPSFAMQRAEYSESAPSVEQIRRLTSRKKTSSTH